MTPTKMLSDFRHARTGDQKKSFHNRTLARPYVDLSQLPVTLEHCEAAAVEGQRLGLRWETEAEPATSYYMGIDQMGGWNAVVVKKRLPDGRQGVVHVEAIHDENPFAKCSEIMERFRVSVCVVEQNPNFNDANAFARRHKGRVYINTAFGNGDMLAWAADKLDPSERKTAEAERTRWQLTVNQYKLMERTLHRVRDRECLFPDPGALTQLVPTKEGDKRVALLRDVVFVHYTKTALVVQDDEITRKPKAFVMKIGLDPHFSYATMLCDAAWAREQGTGSIQIPRPERDPKNLAESIALAAHPTMPIQAVRPPSNTCGGCTAFNAARGWCDERKLLAGARDHACAAFIPRRE